MPPMTRDEWMASLEAQPLFGDLPTTEHTNAIRYHLTSGTSGRVPIRVLDSMKDWEWIAEMWCYGFWAFGVRPVDTVFFAFSYGTFVGFWGAHYACEKIGTLVLAGGNMTTEARVKQILAMKATVVCSTPTYALRMAQEAKTMGVDLAGSAVRRLILSGEPAGSIPATKHLIEEEWGAKAADTAGMTEVGTIMVFECEKQPGGTHIIEDHYIEEVVDPATGEPVGYGELGERLITSFGRVDDMKLVRGTNVYPRAVESIVREFKEIDEFRIHLYTADGRQDEIEILVEIPDREGVNADRILVELAKSLSQAHEGLRFGCKKVENGSLPRFELKAKRLQDDRIVIGTAGERRVTA